MFRNETIPGAPEWIGFGFRVSAVSVLELLVAKTDQL